MFRFVLLILVLLFHSIKALQLSSRNTPTRRRAVIESIFIGTASSAFVYQPLLPAYAVLTSPNFSGPSRELLVSRYYINECAYATKELARAIDDRDTATALGLWEFGKDSWNSYLSIVNRSISPKVGDKFEMIS